jgi:hypothetical protein
VEYERRRAVRYPIALRLELNGASATTRDLSGLGVLFQIDRELRVEDELNFALTIPGACQVQCRGRVVRVTRDGAGYVVGATIDRYLLPEESISVDRAPIHPVLREFLAHNPEGWEWGE